MFLQNLKSVALPVPEIIGVLKKFGQPLDTPSLSFLQKFLWAFIRNGHVNISPNLKSVALPVPEIRGVAKLQTPNLEIGEAIGGRGYYGEPIGTHQRCFE